MREKELHVVNVNENEEQLVTLQEMSKEDWTEIASLAIKMFRSGIHHDHYLRCVFESFFVWMDRKNKVLARDEEQEQTIIH